MVLAGVVFAVVIFGLVVYVIRAATMLNTTTLALGLELKQFKEGGMDRLIADKLSILTKQASQELEARERVIQQTREQLIGQQQRATDAIERFKVDIGTLREKLSSLSELQHQVGELNDLLKPQQLRGELGEVIVRSLITDKLPQGQYEEDFTFSDGKKVEFVIRLGGKLIPVDSKLQLEDFKRMREATEDRQQQAHRTELKRKVRQKIDEVKQYIRPEEGTFNFALMVIPSEAVYYELIGDGDFTERGGLYEYACSQHVFLASPLTFWAYLSAVAHGLRGLEIEQRAEEILSALQNLSGEIRHFAQDEFRKLGTHLRNASSQYEEAEKNLRTIEVGLDSLERGGANKLIEREVAL